MRLFCLLCLPTLWVAGQAPKPAQLTSLRGEVRNAITKEPVAKARLMLVPADGPDEWIRSYAALTDASGGFVIPNVRPGRYRLRVTRNGFVSREHRDLLDLTGKAPALVMRLIPQGVIAGRVLDGDGEPLEQVQVQLLRSRYGNGKKVLSSVQLTQANELGEYRFPGLTPGRYYVFAADWSDGGPQSSAFKEEFVPAYYPNAVDAAGALPLDVAAGAQLRVDMVLRKQPTVTVKGRAVVEVADAPGRPEVRLVRRNSHDDGNVHIWRHRAATVKPSGEFEIQSVPPGPYTAMAEIGKGNRSYAGFAPVIVGGSNVEGVVITIPNPVTLAGRIRVEGEAVVDLTKAEVRCQRDGRRETARPAADGAFRMDGLDPGHCEISVAGLADGFYTKRIQVSGAEVKHVEAGAGPLEILVSPQAAAIMGVVRNGEKTTAGATVVLVPKDKTRRHPYMVADSQGRFQFQNLAPGEYRVYAWEEVETTAWLDPDFLKPLEDRGQPVKVAERGEASVEVKVIPAESDPAG